MHGSDIWSQCGDSRLDFILRMKTYPAFLMKVVIQLEIYFRNIILTVI